MKSGKFGLMSIGVRLDETYLHALITNYWHHIILNSGLLHGPGYLSDALMLEWMVQIYLGKDDLENMVRLKILGKSVLQQQYN